LKKILPKSELQQSNTIKFNLVVAVTSVVFFFYAMWILSGMFENRFMRTPMSKMHMLNYMQHYVRKTFLFYLIIGLTYLVLLLGEEKDGKTDWGMFGQILSNGFFGVVC